MPDRFAHLTPAQQRAILTHDRSMLVSAAAGSGKTTVLAERCAALVCDLPRGERCRIDELLVVTFTDAAAGEMKSRIAAAIRKRLDEQPQRDPDLQEQLYLLEGASISTIHSFCRTVIQRWFPQAGVDPQATILTGEEAQLLREEVLETLFAELYAAADEIGLSFQQLVDDYGAGNDYTITKTVLSLHDYISSLPDPEAWLLKALDRLDAASPTGIAADLDNVQHARIARELQLHIDYNAEVAATIRRCWPVADMHAHSLDEHRSQLERWLKGLSTQHSAVSIQPEAWSAVATDIRDFDLKWNTRRPSGLSDEDKAAFDAAKELRDRSKELFDRRLQKACCAFTADDYREGLQRIAPYTATLVELVRQFEQRYRQAKDAQAVVDFNDLQRYTLRVLADECGNPTDAARHLQRQYRHVLVDEFQDVDPLQESILRLVSRESADPPEGNLFTVGDIKQSIYRFRLAEPKLFTDRADRFAGFANGARSASEGLSRETLACASGSVIESGIRGELIHLRENFRSREGIIHAVNLIFRPLMSRSFGGSNYDETAELVAAAGFADSADGPMFDRPAVEMHLLEPVTERTAVEGDESDTAGASEGPDAQEELEGIEREAWLIGTRIQEWMGQVSGIKHFQVSGRSPTPGGAPEARPIEYRDIVILLRSLMHKAGPIADILRRMGIPVRIDRDQGGLEGTEFDDVISLLQVLDNAQQDIPLAAILRSPVLGEPFNETELLEMRLLDREIPFHQACVRYATVGPAIELRERLAGLFARIDRYRRRIQQVPVAEVLWEIYTETGYLSYVCGLPDGLRRRQHLIRLHDLARQFGQFSRQGLRRFLRFIEDMRERESVSLGASSAGPEENLVRIMTIHASKGLEFPVVILADLQKSFNLTDTRSTVLLDREYGIALRAADAERRIMYPTLIHQLAAEHGIHESLSEELRVLYVALTRAREHLMLVGRLDPAKLEVYMGLHSSGDDPGRIPALQLETAQCPLDWLLPALSAVPGSQIAWPGDDPADQKALFGIHVYGRRTTDQWRLPPPVQADRADALAAIARLQPLPTEEPVAGSADADAILAGLNAHYPGLELTTVPARVTVSELKRRWDAQRDPLERSTESVRRPRPVTYAEPRALLDLRTPPDPPLSRGGALSDAARRGTATHRFLQLLDLSRPADPLDLQEQLAAFTTAGRFTPAEAQSIRLDACAWFLQTELGQRLRANAGRVRREVPFVSRIPADAYDSSAGPLWPALAGTEAGRYVGRDSRDVILVRGMVDVLLDTGSELEMIDYKTDAVEGDACRERASLYRPQIDSYAAAIEAIYGRTVVHRWLVFLHGRCIIDSRTLASRAG